MDGSAHPQGEDLKAAGRKLIRESALVAGQWVQGEGTFEVDDPAE
jgi:hypothetical protein